MISRDVAKQVSILHGSSGQRPEVLLISALIPWHVLHFDEIISDALLATLDSFFQSLIHAITAHAWLAPLSISLAFAPSID